MIRWVDHFNAKVWHVIHKLLRSEALGIGHCLEPRFEVWACQKATSEKHCGSSPPRTHSWLCRACSWRGRRSPCTWCIDPSWWQTSPWCFHLELPTQRHQCRLVPKVQEGCACSLGVDLLGASATTFLFLTVGANMFQGHLDLPLRELCISHHPRHVASSGMSSLSMKAIQLRFPCSLILFRRLIFSRNHRTVRHVLIVLHEEVAIRKSRT